MKHANFILSPIQNILYDSTSASLGVGNGIETFPLCDYVMQSVFLKMTGAQEQKMKCICWELATNDYEYRYLRFNTKTLGECSSYDEKTKIYKDLIKQIEKRNNTEFSERLINKTEIFRQVEDSIKNAFQGSNLVIWAQKRFLEYNEIWKEITADHFFKNKSNLFTNLSNLPRDRHGLPREYGLVEIYQDHLYKQRNRVAHNTLSYQQNLPTLNTLINKNYKYDNYFIYFSILILIDSVFISLYKIYLESLEND